MVGIALAGYALGAAGSSTALFLPKARLVHSRVDVPVPLLPLLRAVGGLQEIAPVPVDAELRSPLQGAVPRRGGVRHVAHLGISDRQIEMDDPLLFLACGTLAAGDGVVVAAEREIRAASDTFVEGAALAGRNV